MGQDYGSASPPRGLRGLVAFPGLVIVSVGSLAAAIVAAAISLACTNGMCFNGQFVVDSSTLSGYLALLFGLTLLIAMVALVVTGEEVDGYREPITPPSATVAKDHVVTDTTRRQRRSAASKRLIPRARHRRVSRGIGTAAAVVAVAILWAGTINSAQVLSPNEVMNGTFQAGTTGWTAPGWPPRFTDRVIPDVVGGLPGLEVTTNWTYQPDSGGHWSEIASHPWPVTGSRRVLFGAWMATNSTNGLSSIVLFATNSTGDQLYWFSIPVLNLPATDHLRHYQMWINIPAGVQFVSVVLQCGQAAPEAAQAVCLFADVSIQTVSPLSPLLS